jgi:hypothetical protein
MKKKPNYLNVSQAAAAKGVSRAAIYNAIREKRLPAKKGTFVVERVSRIVQRGWRISEEDLVKYEISDLHQWIGKKSA